MGISGLINYSYFSRGQSIFSPKQLILSAKEKGYDSLAITELNTFTSLPLFVELGKKYKIKIISGISILLQHQGITFPKNVYFPLSIIVKTKQAYNNLIKLYDLIPKEGILNFEDIKKIKLKDTISIIGGNPFYISSLLSVEKADEFFSMIITEIRNTNTNPILSIDFYGYENYLDKLKNIADSLSLSLVFSNGIRYDNRKDFAMFLGVKNHFRKDKKYNQLCLYEDDDFIENNKDNNDYYSKSYMPSKKELNDLPVLFNEYIKATSIIADDCKAIFNNKDLFNIDLNTGLKAEQEENTLELIKLQNKETKYKSIVSEEIIKIAYKYCYKNNILNFNVDNFIEKSEYAFLNEFSCNNLFFLEPNKTKEIVNHIESLYNNIKLYRTVSYSKFENSQTVTEENSNPSYYIKDFIPDILSLKVFNKNTIENLPMKNYYNKIEYVDFYLNELSEINSINLIIRELNEYKLIRNVLGLVKDLKNEKLSEITLCEINIGIEDVYSFIRNGFTEHVFLLDVLASKNKIFTSCIKSIWDISALISLYKKDKPDMLNKFLLAKKQRGIPHFHDENINKVLEISSGLIIYREQVLYLLSRFGNFTLQECENLIDSVKNNDNSVINIFKEKLVKDATSDGKLLDVTASELFDELIKAINNNLLSMKSALSLAYISYQMAYIKFKYPLQFYVSALNSNLQNHNKIQLLIIEARHIGIKFLPVDINKSQKGFSIFDGKIVMGFSILQSINQETIDNITQKRSRDGDYKNILDFCLRIDSQYLSKTLIEDFIYVGAFDFTKNNRVDMFSLVKDIITRSKKSKEEGVNQQVDLFGSKKSKKSIIDTKMVIKNSKSDWDIGTKLKNEKEACGFYISENPLLKYQDVAARNRCVPINKVKELMGSDVSILGFITGVEVRTTKKGSKWSRIFVDDFESCIEILAFKNNYEKAKDRLIEGKIYIFKGRVNDEVNKKIFLDTLIDVKTSDTNHSEKPIENEVKEHFDYSKTNDLSDLDSKPSSILKIFFKEKLLEDSILLKIKTFLEQFKGDKEVQFLISRCENDRDPIVIRTNKLRVKENNNIEYELLKNFSDYIKRVWFE